MKRTDIINQRDLTNAAFVQYHHTVLTNLKSHGATQLGIASGIVTQYENQQTVLQDYVNRSLGSEFTPRIEQYDRQRDALFLSCLARLQYADSHPNAKVSAAAEVIKTSLIDLYKPSIANEAYMNETAKLRGFAVDAARLGEDVLKALGLDVLLPALKTANDQFEQTYLARNTQRQEVSADVVRQQRSVVSDLYDMIILMADYSANQITTNLGDDDARAAAEEIRDEAQIFVGELNENIAYYRRYYLKSNKTAAKTIEETGDSADEGGKQPSADNADDAGTTGNTNTTGSSGAKTPSDVTEITEE